MTQAEEIFQWMDDNKDFFKPDGICKQLGIDKGNFSKYKSAKSIPEKYIVPIIDIITLYGFKSKLSGEWLNKKDLQIPASKGEEYFKQQISKIENAEIAPKYNFENEQWLILEKYTKFPLSQKPKALIEQSKWLNQKRESDMEIRIAWDEFKKLQQLK